jgi:hypothetical protein
MKKPLIQDPINPKDYPSYEEYREALSIQDQFYEIVEVLDQIFEESETEEELHKKLLSLGFTAVEDGCDDTPEVYGHSV